MEPILGVLVREVRYTGSLQNLAIDLARMPAPPKRRFVATDVRPG